MGRPAEAERLLLECRETFDRHGDLTLLGQVFSALAKIEGGRDRPRRAADMERLALRYMYQRGTVHNIAVCHNNLGQHLTTAWLANGDGADHEAAVAHVLAATLLWTAAGHAEKDSGTQALSFLLPRPAGRLLPADPEDLDGRVAQVPGVRFSEVFSRVLPDPQARSELFMDITRLCERVWFVNGGPGNRMRAPQARPNRATRRRQRKK